MRKLFAVAVLSALSLHVGAQDDDAPVHRYIGIGVRASIFQISDLPMAVTPPNRIIVNVDPIKYARAEFQFGSYSHENELFMSNQQPLNMKQSSVSIGGGVFGMYPVGKAVFLAGLNYTINNYSEDDVLFDNFGVPYVAASTGKVTGIAPTLGGEYYFSKWFSIGAEFSYLILNDEFDPADPNSPQQTSTTFITESSLVFRFHPL